VKTAHDRALEYLDQATAKSIPKNNKPNTEYPPLEVLPIVKQGLAAMLPPFADTKAVIDLTIEDSDEDSKPVKIEDGNEDIKIEDCIEDYELIKEDRPKGARRKRNLDTGETPEVGAAARMVRRT
jgi:hypothetical protein